MTVAELIALLQAQPPEALMFAISANTECAELVSGVALARAEGCCMPTVTILTDDDAGIERFMERVVREAADRWEPDALSGTGTAGGTHA